MGPVTPAAATRTPMSAYKSDFLNVLAERGFIHQVSEPDALDQLAKSQAITADIPLDSHAAPPHTRSPPGGAAPPEHDAARAAADRPPADRADGRRHDARRRSLRQG